MPFIPWGIVVRGVGRGGRGGERGMDGWTQQQMSYHRIILPDQKKGRQGEKQATQRRFEWKWGV